MCIKDNNNYNLAICNTCHEKNSCSERNINLMISGSVLEPECNKSSNVYESTADRIKCKECDNRMNCQHVLDSKIAIGNSGLNYSEFSGYTTIVSPGYYTVDLRELKDVKTIQFLLWDNRGNDKKEPCNRKHYYRLLVSNYNKDLKYEDENIQMSNISWYVLYDSLKFGNNGWQIFHLDKMMKIRYIRLHFLYNSDHMFCNLVRFEAYPKQLVGYNYNFLPTFETYITNPEYVEKKYNINTNINYNSTTMFMSELLRKLDKKIEDNKTDGSYDLMRELQLLRNDLQNVNGELIIYDKRLEARMEQIFHGINTIFKKSENIRLMAIVTAILGIICIILTVVCWIL